MLGSAVVVDPGFSRAHDGGRKGADMTDPAQIPADELDDATLDEVSGGAVIFGSTPGTVPGVSVGG